ncbi:MAG: hypothetical protein KF716_33395 [Anaerolineae bacterium]|nr:hypothetical protein [Anaerolineae bacterium]
MNIAQNWRLKAQRYRLEGIKCETCQKVTFPPREVCPHCREAEMKAKLAGKFEALAVTSEELRAAR